MPATRIARFVLALAATAALTAAVSAAPLQKKDPVDKPFGGRKLPPNTGATQQTERAVLDGLRWLARHQNPDGSWSAKTLRERCPCDDPAYDVVSSATDDHDEGLTGLALLCFLGAGFHQDSKQDLVDVSMGKRHRIGTVVRSGIEWLVARQKPDGSFTRKRPFNYNESIATAAICEAYGLTLDGSLLKPARRAVEFLQLAQRPNPNGSGLWGWSYQPRSVAEKSGDKKQLYESDTSNTGWALMALASARMSTIPVDPASFRGAVEYARWVSTESGLVGYADPKNAGQKVMGLHDEFIYHPNTMSALSMCVQMFATNEASDPFLARAADQIAKDLPTVSKDGLSIDYYSWYWNTLALYQFDGPRKLSKTVSKHWTAWDKALVETLTALQDKREKSCTNGGWMRPDRWSTTGGPLYSTALSVLTLETYYRYQSIGTPLPAPDTAVRLNGASDAEFAASLAQVRADLAATDKDLAPAFEDALMFQLEARLARDGQPGASAAQLREGLDSMRARDVVRSTERLIETCSASELAWIRARVLAGADRAPCSPWLAERWLLISNTQAREAARQGAGTGFQLESLNVAPADAVAIARDGAVEALRRMLTSDPAAVGAIAIRLRAHRDAFAAKVAAAGADLEVKRAIGGQNRSERTAKAALERLAAATKPEDVWKKARAFDAALIELDQAGDEAATRLGVPWKEDAPGAATPAAGANTLAELRARATRFGGKAYLERGDIAGFLAAHPDVHMTACAPGRIALFEGDGDGLVLVADFWCDAQWRIVDGQD